LLPTAIHNKHLHYRQFLFPTEKFYPCSSVHPWLKIFPVLRAFAPCSRASNVCPEFAERLDCGGFSTAFVRWKLTHLSGFAPARQRR
jgi:hypothetical protein